MKPRNQTAGNFCGMARWRRGAVACGAYLPYSAAGTASADSRIDVLLDEPLGLISPTFTGIFIEHLGGVIYDGVWVAKTRACRT